MLGRYTTGPAANRRVPYPEDGPPREAARRRAEDDMGAGSVQHWRETPTWRPVSIGRRGAGASGHALATQPGLQALRAGGNAADAAIATASTLAVAEPQMSG